MFLTETHLQVRDMTRSFADTVLRPAAEELDREERFPSEIYENMAELGLFGTALPEELGGPSLATVSSWHPNSRSRISVFHQDR